MQINADLETAFLETGGDKIEQEMFCLKSKLLTLTEQILKVNKTRRLMFYDRLFA